MKKILSIKYFFYVLIPIAYLFFLAFEVSGYLKIAMLVLVLLSFAMIKMKKTDFALMLTVFLVFYDIFSFLYIRPFGYTFPLGLAMVLTVGMGCFLFYYGLIVKESMDEIKSQRNVNIFYIFILALSLLEVFLAMNFWQIDPKNKSIILLVGFYLVWGLVCLRIENMLTLKKVFVYLLLSFFTLVLVLLTINKWQIY